MRNIKHLFVSLLLLSCFTCVFAENPKREFRATWFTTVTNIDWPNSGHRITATSGTLREKQIQNQKTSMEYFFNHLKNGNMNAVMFQVRSLCDAMYPSSYEPWSASLTGTRGNDPGYDPLAYAVEQAHARGMELHVWVNPYRYETTADKYGDEDIVRKNMGDYLLTYNTSFKGTILDPGEPEVRAYVVKIIQEIVENYDIDGVIFDDYFYPWGGTTTEDAETVKKYKPANQNTDDWRRENVDKLIKEVYDMIQSKKPWVRLGMGPGGIWSTNSSVASKYGLTIPSINIGGANTYSVLFANTVEWMKQGIVDYVAPQIYWSTTNAKWDFDVLSAWWNSVAKRFSDELPGDKKVHYFSSNDDTNAWGTSKEMGLEVESNRRTDALGGTGAVFYNTRQFVEKKINIDLAENQFADEALPPAMDWKTTTALAAPTNLAIDGTTLTWTHASSPRFTVYAYPKSSATVEKALQKAANLLGVTYTNSFDISAITDVENTTFAVCAYDRYGNEYAPVTLNEGKVNPEENPNKPIEGTVSITKQWTTKEVSTGDNNRSIAYYDGKLYVTYKKEGQFYIHNASTGAKETVVTCSGVTLKNRVNMFNLRQTEDGQMLLGNTNGAAEKLKIHSCTTAGVAKKILEANLAGRSDYFYPYGKWSEEGYLVALSQQGNAVVVPYKNSALSAGVEVVSTELPKGTSAKAVPADDESFYASTSTTLPTKHALYTGLLQESFGAVKPVENTGVSGLAVFTLSGHNYMVTPADAFGAFEVFEITEGLSKATKVITATQPLGNVANGAGTIDFAVNVQGNDAYIYVLAPNNGIAAYKFTFKPSVSNPDFTLGSVKFYFQGGSMAVPADNEALWNAMWKEFKAAYSMINYTASGFVTPSFSYTGSGYKGDGNHDESSIARFLQNCFYTESNTKYTAIKNAAAGRPWDTDGIWEWLGDYFYAISSTYPGGILNFCYDTQCFLQTQAAGSLNYNKIDWTDNGQPSAWKPAYIFGHKPTKAGDTFLGWYDNAAGNGSPLTKLPASGDVYACWKSGISTDVDNIETISAIVLRPTYDGVEISFTGTQPVQIYHVNGMLLQSVVATDSYACTLSKGMYIIRVGNEVRKYIQ